MKDCTVKLFVFLLLFSYAIVPAQQKPKCFQCKQEINGEYIKAGDKTFHPEHFICAGCGKVIRGEYKDKNNEFYHPDCYAKKAGLICAYCNKLLNGEYVVYENKKYHKDCLREHVLEKCAVCGEPIDDRFVIDGYKNKYHAYHKNEYPECSCCGRLICGVITGGGVKYPDGRNVCSICYKTAVSDQNTIKYLLSKVKSKLVSMGLNFGSAPINIKGVDRNELKNNDPDFNTETRGYCNSQVRTETLNGRIIKKVSSHQILVLKGIPEILMESIIAHELMHAWMNDNTSNSQPARIREGSCNFISYLYLNSRPPSQTEEYIRQLEENPDPVYGEGFRIIKNRFISKRLNELLNYLIRSN